MGSEIEVRIKQDFVNLKPQVSPPNTENEAVLFVDETGKNLSFKESQNGAVIDLSTPVVPSIPSLAELGAAAAGNNTDIVSLGQQSIPFAIQGILNLPGNSAFKAYAADVTYTPNYITYDIVTFDALNEFANNIFKPKHDGLYLFVARAELITYYSSAFRSITLLSVNNVEKSRGQDSTVSVNYGGNLVVGLLNLEKDDTVQVNVYTDVSAQTVPGESKTFFTGIKIA